MLKNQKGITLVALVVTIRKLDKKKNTSLKQENNIFQASF